MLYKTEWGVNIKENKRKIQLHHIRTYDHKAPPWGLSTQRAPKELFQKIPQSKLVVKYAFVLRICTMFCMREATYISDGFHMRTGTLGP